METFVRGALTRAKQSSQEQEDRAAASSQTRDRADGNLPYLASTALLLQCWGLKSCSTAPLSAACGLPDMSERKGGQAQAGINHATHNTL